MQGYAAERKEILDFLRDSGVRNVVFLTGDLHANVIVDVRQSVFTDPTPRAKEFIAGPVSEDTLFAELVARMPEPSHWAIQVDGVCVGGIGVTLGEGIFVKSGLFGYWLATRVGSGWKSPIPGPGYRPIRSRMFFKASSAWALNIFLKALTTFCLWSVCCLLRALVKNYCRLQKNMRYM